LFDIHSVSLIAIILIDIKIKMKNYAKTAVFYSMRLPITKIYVIINIWCM